MWKCEKCGREFKNEGQNHYCGKAPVTIDEYILMQPEENRERLTELRKAIKDAIPEAAEKISWSMPAFWSGRNIIQFSTTKNHTGIHVGEEAIAKFADRITPYKAVKGTIRVKHTEPMPLELICEIAKWNYEN